MGWGGDAAAWPQHQLPPRMSCRPRCPGGQQLHTVAHCCTGVHAAAPSPIFWLPQEWVKVEGWALPELPPLITDILISLDDK